MSQSFSRMPPVYPSPLPLPRHSSHLPPLFPSFPFMSVCLPVFPRYPCLLYTHNLSPSPVTPLTSPSHLPLHPSPLFPPFPLCLSVFLFFLGTHASCIRRNRECCHRAHPFTTTNGGCIIDCRTPIQ